MTGHSPAEARIDVRPATTDELDVAGDVVAAAYRADELAHEEYFTLLRDARDRARDAEVAVAVEASGRVIGCVTFATPGSRWAEVSREGEAEFRMLGVLPEARGRGVGSALVDWCVARAGQLGVRRLVICSETSMTTAHRIYARRGFVRQAELDWSPVPGVQLLGFALDL